MDQFDEYERLFAAIGLSESASKLAAIGRYRNEAEAREAYAEDEAADLAEQLCTGAAHRPSQTRQELAQISAAVPVVVENVLRQFQGQAPLPVPGQVLVDLPAVAEAVVEPVREALRMTESDARVFAARLHDREVRRGGADHAGRFLRSFGESLRVQVREVAAR
jgi:hypothetical protein